MLVYFIVLALITLNSHLHCVDVYL